MVLKEGRPGILLALEPDLSAIRDHQVLTPERGFRVSGCEPDDLDYSDLCYDSQRDRFWILSEQASTLFLYDWPAGQVEATLPLRHGPPGAQQPIAKGEGLAVDPEAGRLWVAGEWIDVDVEAITLGMLEDIESFQKVGLVLDALSSIITASSITPQGAVPEGMSPVRAVLRGLRPPLLAAANAHGAGGRSEGRAEGAGLRALAGGLRPHGPGRRPHGPDRLLVDRFW